MYGTPNISRPATAGINTLHLSWHVLTGVRPVFAPRERAASNLQKPAALQQFLLADSVKCTTARITIPDRPSLGLPRTALLDLIFRRQWKISYKEEEENNYWQLHNGTSGLIATELAKYNIDIAALCETRFSESGSLNHLEYSFFWRGKPEGERKEAGVGYRHKADRNARPVSDRIMTMRLPLSKDKFATIISVYAPRKTNQDEKGGLLQPAGKCAQWISSRLTSRRPRCCTNPTLQEPERRIS